RRADGLLRHVELFEPAVRGAACRPGAARAAHRIPGKMRIGRRRMVRVGDCFPELKEITEARERRYRAHPDKPAPEGPQSFVEVKVTSIGQLNELVACKKSGHKFIISEPVHVGGQNCAPTPLEFLLSGAVGCYAAVFAFYAAKLGVRYDSFEAVARTDFDVRGHMMADAPSSGFRNV